MAAPSTPRSRRSALAEVPTLLVVSVLIAALLRTFAVQVFYIPSSSMHPTLQVDDRIIVDKVSFHLRDVRRGEIVVFSAPAAGRAHEPGDYDDYVKRVVGLPGETVQVTDRGAVLVNGVPLDETYVGEPDPRGFGPVVVPDGALFVMGDNRPSSADSRSVLGFVPVDRLIGRVVAVAWPAEHATVVRPPDYDPRP